MLNFRDETGVFGAMTIGPRPAHNGSANRTHLRPKVRGKFLFIGDEKYFVKGVTYGPFRMNSAGCEYHTPNAVERDFALMAQNGINTVRVYTVPPRWLLDIAQKHGLRVMVGLPWEQHITFLDDERTVQTIEGRVRDGVKVCVGHPAVLCYVIGNEIPAPIVRWHGRQKVENFLKRLYLAAKSEDPGALVTYVNFPTTEYLQLPFVDFMCFNVYLEQQDRLESYIARLQNLAGEKPLVMAELGLDSMRNGQEKQASVLRWQIRSAFSCGAAGMFVFAWTDEWHRGGHDIEDWDFGLVDRNRNEKKALAAVREAYADLPFPRDTKWPSVSVVCCTYNGHRTIRDTMEGLMQLDYPDFEVIVVNDGSTTPEVEKIVKQFPFKLISIPNGGLSNARNVGMRAARGHIVAYIDDDARPDKHWLRYLAWTFMKHGFGGVGGPNIAPPGDGDIADCVANSPGGPVHVLYNDVEAEHIPGCNMAFLREALIAVGGCDAQFRIAGDDVDLCWRIQDAGWKLGFAPAAVVWHHRRNSVKAYWKQQLNYGKAEAMLERKWPEKYNAVGHIPWIGRLYGKGLMPSILSLRSRIYHGTWGTAPFQSLYEPAPGILSSLPMMPEWYMLTAALGLVSLMGLLWAPLAWALPLFIAAMAMPVIQACKGARMAQFADAPRTNGEKIKKYALTAMLHIMQPLSRLRGRLTFGLTPWRRRLACGFAMPLQRRFSLWSEEWQAPEQRLHGMIESFERVPAVVTYGGNYDNWDLKVRGGLFGRVRLRMTIEEHGAGKQLIRFMAWPTCPWIVWGLWGLFAVLAISAFTSGAVVAGSVLAVAAALIGASGFYECGQGMAVVRRAVEIYNQSIQPKPAAALVTESAKLVVPEPLVEVQVG
jgi:GT2 family glycosyltransferase